MAISLTSQLIDSNTLTLFYNDIALGIIIGIIIGIVVRALWWIW